MPKPKTVTVMSLRPGQEFETTEEVMGLEPDRYTFAGGGEAARYDSGLANGVFVEDRRGDRYVIPGDTQVIPLD